MESPFGLILLTLTLCQKKLVFEGLTGQIPGEGLLELIDKWNSKMGIDVKKNVDDYFRRFMADILEIKKHISMN